MTNPTFAMNDRVVYKPTGDVGTVLRQCGDVVRVFWHDSETDTSVHPLELAHKKDGSISDQESATANETNTHEKDDFMNKTINSDRPEATPPAGFRSFTETDNEGNDFQSTQGPEEWTGNIQVSSHWSIPNGIEFFVHNDRHESGFIFSREELEEIPGMIKSVLESIDLAHAIEHMKANPIPKRYPRWTTITDIAAWCDEHKINQVAAYAAFEQLHSEELKAEGWKNA